MDIFRVIAATLAAVKYHVKPKVLEINVP